MNDALWFTLGFISGPLVCYGALKLAAKLGRDRVDAMADAIHPERRRYKRRTTYVYAEPYVDGRHCKGVYGWSTNARLQAVILPEGPYDVTGPAVITLQKVVVPVKDGEIIIQESDGIHHYPCDPKEFARLYELAEDQ